MNIPSALKSAQKLLIDHSPALLTSLGVAGAVTASILTAKATWAAARLVNEHNRNLDIDDLYMAPKKKAELVWQEYIPPAIVLGTTVVCVIAANKVGTRRAAALAAAFKVSEEMAAEYRTKVVDSIGKNAEEKVRVAVAEDRMNQNPQPATIIFAGNKPMMYDSFSGRYFECSIEDVKSAVNEINFSINSEMYASLSDFYEKIGLPATSASDEFGWNADTQLEVDFVPVITDGKVTIEIQYDKTPIRGYARVH